jgi:hypothetical protein
MKTIVCGVICVFAATAFADDWPMYRRDAGRTAVTGEELPANMQLRWTRQLPPLIPAFHNARLQFDAGYEPVVAEGKLLVASSRTDSVTAYDSGSGKQLWKFATNGPIRCAPAIWNNFVCFGSDDGYCYCVELSTGALLWKHRAVPSDRRLLGNRRLISVWPVRGGPVVEDGRVYFAAGVWPFEGVFVYCIDVESGQVIWRNDRLGYLYGTQPHNTTAIGGLAPQGYLVINGEELIVPCSTAYPARLNRDTGELIEFELPAPGRLPGGWFAALDPATAKDLRRGKIVYDDLVNSQLHEDKVHKGQGQAGLSRSIISGSKKIGFDEKFPGIEGEIHSILLAAGRVFVVERSGRISCFSAAERGPNATPTNWDDKKRTLDVSPATAKRARRLVEAASTKHGIAMVIGLEDGALVKGLVAESEFQLIVFDDDPRRVERLRAELALADIYADRAAVLLTNVSELKLPPYLAELMVSERTTTAFANLMNTLRPYGGTAVFAARPDAALSIAALQPLAKNFKATEVGEEYLVLQRVGALPGASNYSGDWTASPDELVKFPLGVLWFDDTLAHFKRSPQPVFVDGLMISRPKDWHAPRTKGNYAVDYPLLPPVLSDIYTGRVIADDEATEVRASLPATDPAKAEPSQYRPPRQADAWKPEQPVVGTRNNPLSGEAEPRSFPKTYGCDGGVDYGNFFTLRSGTAAFYDKTIESGTVFLSGPRSGCTNSIIPAGGLLNVPYYYEGCTCSYPLPSAMSLYSLPESHEQWSSWGDADLSEKEISRVGFNFGAPGDRMTRGGTLWLDAPSVGGPSPTPRLALSPEKPRYQYHHSVWMEDETAYPWVAASTVEGLRRFSLQGLKKGRYTVRLYFAEVEPRIIRIQTITIQGQTVLEGFNIATAAGGTMRSVVKEFGGIQVEKGFEMELVAAQGETLISGIELIHESRE